MLLADSSSTESKLFVSQYYLYNFLFNVFWKIFKACSVAATICWSLRENIIAECLTFALNDHKFVPTNIS